MPPLDHSTGTVDIRLPCRRDDSVLENIAGVNTQRRQDSLELGAVGGLRIMIPRLLGAVAECSS